jgi:hypothetical protein
MPVGVWEHLGGAIVSEEIGGEMTATICTQPRCWASGRSLEEALGRLLLEHPNEVLEAVLKKESSGELKQPVRV